MVRVWVIRGGDDNRLVDEFIDNKVVGVGYYCVPDATTISESEVTAILRAEKVGALGQRAKRFRSFLREMARGDVVVMPDTPRGEVVIGAIAGDYKYWSDLSVDRYRHRRPVNWLGRHPHSDLPRGREEIYRQRQTLRELEAPDIVEHAIRVRRGEVGRAAADRRDVANSETRSRTTGARKAAGLVVAEKLCPGCGQLRAPTQLAVHGGVCADCAHDS